MQETKGETSAPLNNDLHIATDVFNISDLISSLDEKLVVTEEVVTNSPFSQEVVQIHIEEAEIAIEDMELALEIPTIESTTVEERVQEIINDEITTESYDDTDGFLQMIQSITPESLISIDSEKEPEIMVVPVNILEQEILKINSERKHKKISELFINQAKFLANYVIVSAFVFFLLLGLANYSAYSTIAYNFVNPDNLKSSSKDILNVIDNSKIKVFADEDTSILGIDQQLQIQQKLAENNTQLRDTYFSPKKLVPLKSNVNLTVDIVPYENRLIIPKIGKNIPLVDVDARRGNLDFLNLENIFMSELEKGVLRYPGTAKPGENGVSFIFGHSSNYPWLKGEYNDVFAMLDNLESGDEIIVYYNQKKYTYVINEKKVIKPGNIKILERDPAKKELSLMTCWPIGTTINRLITFAELKSVN